MVLVVPIEVDQSMPDLLHRYTMRRREAGLLRDVSFCANATLMVP